MKFNGRNINIHTDTIIGSNVKIGDNTTIYGGVEIGDNTIIANDCVIGEPLNSYYFDEKYNQPKTSIGKNSLLRSHSIIYTGSVFGDFLQTGHRVTIRENTKAGHHCSFGTNNDIQGDCVIGNYCRFQSFVNVGQKSEIGDFVFIYPFVVLTNDPMPPSNNIIGVKIDDFSQITSGSIILPGKKIGKHCLVAANSTIGIDLPDYSFATGNPAKVLGDIRKLPLFSGNKRHYPWPYHFNRGLPWEKEGYEVWLNSNK
jgi:acetyltransferase-like isoleucine patch superfamily enzyme